MIIEKKYQVFVSSTYRDLIEERQEVMQALLEQDCIPVGMELFPAADEDQWSLIKRLIDDCDYYLVIVGGRYGSTNEEGVSYTQLEYEYAMSIGIPIMGFLHENPGQIIGEKIDKDIILTEKLEKFKALVQKKLCKYYASPADLGGKVSRSLIRMIKDKPRTGWVKASLLPSDDINDELLKFRKQNEELKDEVNRLNTNAPIGTENLSQGRDSFNIQYSSTEDWSDFGKDEMDIGSIPTSWDEIFSYVSPLMINEKSELDIASALNEFIKLKIKQLEIIDNKRGFISLKKAISKPHFFKIIVQFTALGLIKKSAKKRSISDAATYWSLTPYGESTMINLLAIRKVQG